MKRDIYKLNGFPLLCNYQSLRVKMLKFHNTLTRKKDEFKPIKKGTATMYSCGPTVYNFAHIGNFRAYIFEDQLRRYLIYKGFKVIQVKNLTDVDDKTIRDSQREGLSLDKFTEIYKKAFFDDNKTLNILPADFYPEATKTIPEMLELIQTLMDKGFAYKGEDGSVYFSINKFKDYGKLSKIPLDQQKAGARVKQDEYQKDNAADFALWKAWSEDDGDVSWESPFGKGRPGWHLECSAMSMKHLGETFDIHTGGIDLVFPHHEDEIAQSECATGKPFAKFWMHCEHLLVEGKKMSKSLGNFFTLRDILDQGYKPSAIRYELLSTHYRQQLNFTFESLKAAQASVDRLQEFVDKLKAIKDESGSDDPKKLIATATQGFEEAMDDDLNISIALSHIFNFLKEANKLRLNKSGAILCLEFMQRIDSVLGVMNFKSEDVPAQIMKLVAKREEARKSKEWALADKLRDQVKDLGYIIQDGSDGPRITKA